jgi:hypothetical protein
MQDNNSNENPSWGDVIAEQHFLVPAGAGLAIVALAILFHSPFKWVLLFAYFLIGLPLLAYYIRNRMPQALNDLSEQTLEPEPEAGRRVRTALEHLVSSKNIDEDQLKTALTQYQELEAVRRSVRRRLLRAKSLDSDEDSRSRGIAASDQVYQNILGNLYSCSVLFAKLDAIDTTALIKQLQVLRAGREYDAVKELAAKRERMISQVLDRMKSGKLFLQLYKGLSVSGLPPGARMQQLRELAEKSQKLDPK